MVCCCIVPRVINMENLKYQIVLNIRDNLEGPAKTLVGGCLNLAIVYQNTSGSELVRYSKSL